MGTFSPFSPPSVICRMSFAALSKVCVALGWKFLNELGQLATSGMEELMLLICEKSSIQMQEKSRRRVDSRPPGRLRAL